MYGIDVGMQVLCQWAEYHAYESPGKAGKTDQWKFIFTDWALIQ